MSPTITPEKEDLPLVKPISLEKKVNAFLLINNLTLSFSIQTPRDSKAAKRIL